MQEGCVIVPTVGAAGVTGCELITTLLSGDEVHPDSLVTVNEYVFAVNPVIEILVPVPVMDPPGVLVRVQVPDEGRPLSNTLPVAEVHVGCVTEPSMGADGVTGCGLI